MPPAGAPAGSSARCRRRRRARPWPPRAAPGCRPRRRRRPRTSPAPGGTRAHSPAAAETRAAPSLVSTKSPIVGHVAAAVGELGEPHDPGPREHVLDVDAAEAVAQEMPERGLVVGAHGEVGVAGFRRHRQHAPADAVQDGFAQAGAGGDERGVARPGWAARPAACAARRRRAPARRGPSPRDRSAAARRPRRRRRRPRRRGRATARW